MLTKEDKTYLNDTFATKKEMRKEISGVRTDTKSLKTDVADLKTDVADLKTDVVELKIDVAELKVDSKLMQQAIIRIEQRMDVSDTKSDKILTILQGFAGSVGDLEQENRFGAMTLRRHDVQIHELAIATDTTISE